MICFNFVVARMERDILQFLSFYLHKVLVTCNHYWILWHHTFYSYELTLIHFLFPIKISPSDQCCPLNTTHESRNIPSQDIVLWNFWFDNIGILSVLVNCCHLTNYLLKASVLLYLTSLLIMNLRFWWFVLWIALLTFTGIGSFCKWPYHPQLLFPQC